MKQLNNNISGKDMMKVMAGGNVVHLKWVSFDRKRKLGGKLKEDMELVLLESKDGNSLGRHHFKNFTRNFEQCVGNVRTGKIVKIHIPLIIEINGLNVSL